MSLLTSTYKYALLNTKRGQNHGIFSNAKPLLVISIIDAINEGVVLGNKIPFGSLPLQEIYKSNYKRAQDRGDELYRSNTKWTPINLPFFHLNAEPYYHIKWKDGVVPPKQALSPSAKFLLQNVDYAYLDNELWELLQSAECRAEFKESLLKKFITPDNQQSNQ